MGDAVRSHELDPAEVNVGDLMSFPCYGKVLSNSLDGSVLSLENVDTGLTFEARGALVRAGFSANQVFEEVELGKVKGALLLSTCFGAPVAALYLKKDGSERLVRGYQLPPSEPATILGYTLCVDCMLPHDHKGSRVRSINHNTHRWFIWRGVKYTIK